MKKIIISILTFSFLMLYGCYKGDQTVTVKINLQNLHAAKNVQPKTFLDKVRSFFIKNAYAADPDLFIAAEKGSEILTTVSTSYEEISANGNTVELEVPAGDDITILVVNANTDTHSVDYYGYQKVNLVAGKTENVAITMDEELWCDNDCLWSITKTNGPGCDYSTISWPPAGIPVKYYIKDQSSGEIIYQGYDTQCIIPSMTNYYFYVEFIPFNLKTSEISFNSNGGC